MWRVLSFIVGGALAVSLIGNVALARMYVQQAAASEKLEDLEAVEALDATHRQERDVLAELIPAVTSEVDVGDLKAYFGAVYSGEPIDIAEDPECIGCVVLSWRSFHFAFDATGRLSKVDVASEK